MHQILVYGDSLTWGIIPNTRKRLAFHERWPNILENSLSQRGLHVRIIEDCLNGRRTVWDDPFKPGRNGLQILRELRDHRATRLLPVLIVSSDDPIARARCIEWGADDFLSKPPAASLLQARVGACLEAYRARSHFRRVLDDTFPAPIAEALEKGARPPPRSTASKASNTSTR